jgi:uncharacterized protein with HEPN domain
VKDDRVYLEHILDSIRRIESYTAAGASEFMASTLHQDATLRALQTMAEASQHLSDTAKTKRPEVDWRAIAGFRNVLVHNYLGLDLEQVFTTIQRDVPALKTAVVFLLSNSEKG